MYLKGVEICGFKSFGERIKIDFTGGITSIVGPNGSGKSNILDGILWVLGEQSYKNIRAKESKDIVFSGGEGKKPASYAEVSLFIDNKDNFFPIESKEIKITRKMNLKGENDYLINDKKVRLKDVGELFLDTGVGKSAYSVIGQGKVERIISSSNKEIKGIIEEAAGVKKFQQKRAEAEKRLEKVQVELEKIEFILNETGQSRQRVEKQAKKAEEFLKLKDEKNILQKSVLVCDFEAKKRILNGLTKNEEELTGKVNELDSELQNKERELEELENNRKILLEKIKEFTEVNGNLKEQIESLEREKIRIKERITSYEKDINQREEEAISIENSRVLKQDDYEKLKKEQESFLKKVDELEKENSDFENEISEKERIRKEIEIAIELKKKKIMELEVEKLKLVNEIESSNRRMKGSEFKINSLNEERKEYLKRIDEIKIEIEKSIKEKEKKQKALNEAIKKQKEIEAQITEYSKTINKGSEIIRNTEFENKRNTARLQALYKVEENNEGFYKGVKEILNSGIKGVEGAVISLISVPEEYQKAIESAIPGNLQDIIVTTSDVAKKAIELLKEKKAGKASFLALDTVKVGNLKELPKVEGVIDRASNIVTADEKYRKILEMLLGNILVVDKMDTALKILKNNIFSGNIVTIAGELVSSRGRITGGDTSNSIASQIFERKKEMKQLEEAVKSTEKVLKEWNEKIEQLNKKLEKLEEEITEIDSNEESLRKENRLAEDKVLDLKQKEEKIQKEFRIIEIELEEEQNYNKEYIKRLESSTTEKETLENLAEEIKKELELEEERIQEIKQKLEELKIKFSDKKILYMNSKDRVAQIVREIEKMELEEREFEEKKEKNKNLFLSLKTELEKLYHRDNEASKEIEEKIKKFEEENEELKEMKEKEIRLSEEEKNIIKITRELEATLINQKNSAEREHEKKEKIETELKEIEIQLDELSEIENIKIEENKLKEFRNKVKEMEYKINSFENINLLAIEEFKELDERYNYIKVQRDDLVSGEKSLQELIKEVDETIESRFYEAYGEINKNFNEMCMETLDNSEGQLSLHNGEDYKNCGVEIHVKYKNKKRQALSLLSGGEKSMVAIAFIMAIFMYKPSPFTFLDEIEAALDEKNTRKLIAKLKQFTDRSQFILITHNKETMKASDSLYGVTMNKKIGISKLVSVRI